MPDDFFPPLPRGLLGDVPVTSGKFYNIEVYGDIYAEGGTISGDLDVSGDLDITGDMSISGDFYSSNWVSGGGSLPLSLPDGSATAGFALDGSAGTAQFQTVYAEGGDLGTLDVTGVLTMGTGGEILTAASGQRIRFTNVDRNLISFYSGDVDETYTGKLAQGTNGSGATRTIQFGLYAPTLNDVDGLSPNITVRSGSQDGSTFPPGIIISQAVPDGSAGTGPAGIFSVEQNMLSFFSGDISINSGADLYIYEADNSNWLWADTSARALYLNDASGVEQARFIENDIGLAVGGSLGFGSSFDDQLYQVADSNLGIKIAGTKVVDIDASTFNVITDLSLTGDLYLGDNDYITFNDTDNRFGFFIDGARVWYMSQDSSVQSSLIPFDSTGSFFDTKLLYNNTSAQWGLEINGTREFTLGTTGILIPNVYNSTSGSAANVFVDSAGQLFRSTSARKYKEQIEYADWLATYDLRPVRYKRKDAPQYYYGFIADELAEEDDLLGIYNDDSEVEDYDTRAVLAVLAAKINRLEEQMKGCTCHVI